MSLKYPKHLHDSHNSFPLCPEKKIIQASELSAYQRKLARVSVHYLPVSQSGRQLTNIINQCLASSCFKPQHSIVTLTTHLLHIATYYTDINPIILLCKQARGLQIFIRRIQCTNVLLKTATITD